MVNPARVQLEQQLVKAASDMKQMRDANELYNLLIAAIDEARGDDDE